MTPDLSTLRAELHAEIDRRIDAAQKKADVEPPMLTETMLDYLYKWGGSISTQRAAATRIRYVEAELARLREGLIPQSGDATDKDPAFWASNEPRPECWGVKELVQLLKVAHREILRHRALVKKVEE